MAMRQYACSRMAQAVVLLQWSLLLTLWVTPTWTPPKVKLFELLWAWMHRPTFYPLIALVIAGPVLTILAWTSHGTHRIWLVLSWLVFAAVIQSQFSERVTTMVRVLWWVHTSG